MARSPVLSGRIDARDRARQRHRHDRAPQPEADAYAAIETWLQASTIGELTATALMRLNLDDYLRDTHRIDLSASERLRHLAVYLEGLVADGAAALDRIYEAAVRLDPDGPSIWHSRGITAKYFASIAKSQAERERLAQRARKFLKRADALLPDDADILYSLGKWQDAFGSKSAALECFDRLLVLEPTHGSARLCRAYALHDLGRWQDAIQAYDEVPLEQFTGSRAYVADAVLMNRGDCKLMSRDRNGALAEFRRLMDRFEKEPHRAAALELRNLESACLGEFASELRERWLALGVTAR
ncbi:MAG: hypothetical protein R3B07_02335 [Polyangiaceae bacterium]